MNFGGINFGAISAFAATAAGKGTELSKDDKDAAREKDRALMRDIFKHKAVEQERKPKGNEKSYLA